MHIDLCIICFFIVVLIIYHPPLPSSPPLPSNKNIVEFSVDQIALKKKSYKRKFDLTTNNARGLH